MTKKSKIELESKLTKDQKRSLKEFSKWFKDTSLELPFVLNGCAGSGKTFISMYFLKLVEESNICWTVAAPTHKAVGVLRKALLSKDLQPTWYPSTIHRLLRLKIKRKDYKEICERTKQTENALEQIGLVLIDESSMIDSNLLEIALQCAHNFNTRLVFVGDPAQLPPVGEEQSPVFSIKRSIKFELKEVIRHQGPVLNLASSFRDGSLECNSPPIFSPIVSERGTVGTLDRDNWLTRAKNSLRLAYECDNPDGARILCYTNRIIESLVPHARRAVHGDMADQLPVLPGEVLMSRLAVMASSSIDDSKNREEPDMLIGSNRELTVLDVKNEVCDLKELGLIEKDDWEFPIINTLIAKVSSDEHTFNLRLLPPAESTSRKAIDTTLNRLANHAKNLGNQEGRNIWRSFFLIRDSFASLGPASVLTVHRSQGSTFDEVYIAPDVFWPKDRVLRRQLVYVAVSRAKKAVWLVGGKSDENLIDKWSKLISPV